MITSAFGWLLGSGWEQRSPKPTLERRGLSYLRLFAGGKLARHLSIPGIGRQEHLPYHIPLVDWLPYILV